MTHLINFLPTIFHSVLHENSVFNDDIDSNLIFLKQCESLSTNNITLIYHGKNVLCEKVLHDDNEVNCDLVVINRISALRSVEHAKRVLMNDVISIATADEILQSFQMMSVVKKRKNIDNYRYFDFDSIPSFEPLENHLILLRKDSGSVSALNSILKMDLVDFRDHPQWFELLSILENASITSEASKNLVISIYFRILVGFRSERQVVDLALQVMNMLVKLSIGDVEVNALTELDWKNYRIQSALLIQIMKLPSAVLNEVSPSTSSSLLELLFCLFGQENRTNGTAVHYGSSVMFRMISAGAPKGQCCSSAHVCFLAESLSHFLSQYPQTAVLASAVHTGLLTSLYSFLIRVADTPLSSCAPSAVEGQYHQYLTVVLFLSMIEPHVNTELPLHALLGLKAVERDSPQQCHPLPGTNGRHWPSANSVDENLPPTGVDECGAASILCKVASRAHCGLWCGDSDSSLSDYVSLSVRLVGLLMRLATRLCTFSAGACTVLVKTSWDITCRAHIKCDGGGVHAFSLLNFFVRQIHSIATCCSKAESLIHVLVAISAELSRLQLPHERTSAQHVDQVAQQQSILRLWTRLLSMNASSTQPVPLSSQPSVVHVLTHLAAFSLKQLFDPAQSVGALNFLSALFESAPAATNPEMRGACCAATAALLRRIAHLVGVGLCECLGDDPLPEWWECAESVVTGSLHVLSVCSDRSQTHLIEEIQSSFTDVLSQQRSDSSCHRLLELLDDFR